LGGAVLVWTAVLVGSPPPVLDGVGMFGVIVVVAVGTAMFELVVAAVPVGTL
jgi:hypothetical protein